MNHRKRSGEQPNARVGKKKVRWKVSGTSSSRRKDTEVASHGPRSKNSRHPLRLSVKEAQQKTRVEERGSHIIAECKQLKKRVPGETVFVRRFKNEGARQDA